MTRLWPKSFLTHDNDITVIITIRMELVAGIMAELFDVAQQEYSVIFLWTYSVAALALTFWSTVFMYIVA